MAKAVVNAISKVDLYLVFRIELALLIGAFMMGG
jgi:hypothetical protein